MDCCSQLDILISGRFSVVTVSCLVIAIYLFTFIINQQYMIKVTQRYNIAFLNHNGDLINLMTSIFFTLVFLYFRYSHAYQKNGPPLVDYDVITPRGNNIYAYYGLPSPK